MASRSGPDRDPDTLPPETRIGRVALRVADSEAVTEFYRDVVGLSVLEKTATGSVLGAGDTPMLVLDGAKDVPERRSSEAGLFHVAVRVPSRAALGEALARVRDHWHLEGAADHGVSEALYLRDPEGNGLEIYRDFPRDEWPSAPDGGVEMVTEPLDLDPIEATATGASTVPVGTDVGHVHLEVTDLAAFRAVAIEALGVEEMATMTGATFLSAGGYHHHVGANTWNRRTEPVGEAGLSWFEVVVPDGDAVQALGDRMAERQYPVTETEAGIAVVGPDRIEIRVRVAE